jgi:beta-lactamase regulating signal transducer with metallopeptidase domain
VIFATLGWVVIHALWIGAPLGAVTAFALGLLPDHRARLRYSLAYATLLLMLVVPMVMTMATLDPFTPATRVQASHLVEGTIGLNTLVEWRGPVVRGAAAIWIAGLLLRLFRVAIEWRRIRRVRRLDVAEAGPALGTLVSTLSTELGVRQPVTVLRSRRADVPMVAGWRHATIFLPLDSTTRLQPQQLRGVLAHELAHVRRGDYAANLLQVAVETLLWFHPAARWMSSRVRTEREYCCDDVAVRSGTDAADYARSLAALEDARDNCQLMVAAASGTLLDRLQRIVGHPRPVLTPRRGALTLIVALIVATVILTLALVVPPQMPLDTRLRSKTPGPGSMMPRPEGRSFPRTPQR